MSVVELVGVNWTVNVVKKLPTKSPVDPVVCDIRSGLCSSPAGQAVEFDSRATHPQTLLVPPDGVTTVGKLDMCGVVVHVLVEQLDYCG